ncbi:MAG: dihydroorotate dehydrogenase electron transfer subunit [Eubacteriales bacterium]|nr:dihydroorotate dehydrogenase electron transfer subunit [Eubacteriales bacterium]
MKAKRTMAVAESTRLADGVYSLTLQYRRGEGPEQVTPGQFVGVYLNDPSALLPRPISVCRWNEESARLRLVYRVAGRGTGELSALREGDEVSVLGMLGNGYDLKKLSGKHVLLLGGGIGIPPMLELAAALRRERERCPEAGGGRVTAVLGYRDSQLFLKKEFDEVCDEVLVATEDGSAGAKGNVLDAVREAGLAPQIEAVCACGPMPMLRAVKRFAQEAGAEASAGVPCYISLEERMACGVGACLGCVCKTTEVDEHSKVHNARICTEGPVFEAGQVDIG